MMKVIALLALLTFVTISFPKFCLAEETTEYMLAVLNAHPKIIERDDITITRFRYLLQNIRSNTKDKPTDKGMGSAILYMRDELQKKYGVKINLLEFTEGLNKFLNDRTIKPVFTEALTWYALFYSKTLE